MAQQYTVKQVSQQPPKEWQGANGTVYYIKTLLEGHSKPVSIGKKSPNALKVGDTVYGTITPTQYEEDKFKAEKPAGSFGSKYSRDDAAIRAQWAIGQAMTKFEQGCYAATDENRVTLLHNIRDFARELYAMVDEVKGSGEPKDASLKAQWDKTLIDKQATAQPADDTPPVDAYDDIGEGTEINLDDIPF